MEAGSRIAFDTDVLVGHLRGKTEALLRSEGVNLATTIINAFELYHGAFKSSRSEVNLAKANSLLSTLEILTFDLKTAERAGQTLSEVQRKGENLEIRDLLIGCVARERGYSVVTNNVKHFRKIPNLRVVKASDMQP